MIVKVYKSAISVAPSWIDLRFYPSPINSKPGGLFQFQMGVGVSKSITLAESADCNYRKEDFLRKSRAFLPDAYADDTPSSGNILSLISKERAKLIAMLLGLLTTNVLLTYFSNMELSIPWFSKE